MRKKKGRGEGQERSLEWGRGGQREKRKNRLWHYPARVQDVRGIKGTFEEQEDDSESAERVVSMITRSGEIFWVWAHESPPQASSEKPCSTITDDTDRKGGGCRWRWWERGGGGEGKRTTNDGGVRKLQKLQHSPIRFNHDSKSLARVREC